jgi:hypothetical protein
MMPGRTGLNGQGLKMDAAGPNWMTRNGRQQHGLTGMDASSPTVEAAAFSGENRMQGGLVIDETDKVSVARHRMLCV